MGTVAVDTPVTETVKEVVISRVLLLLFSLLFFENVHLLIFYFYYDNYHYSSYSYYYSCSFSCRSTYYYYCFPTTTVTTPTTTATTPTTTVTTPTTTTVIPTPTATPNITTVIKGLVGGKRLEKDGPLVCATK